MKQSEKQRLMARIRDAVARMTVGNPRIKERAEKAAAKFSPTNAERYRTLSEIVWWLIAADCGEDAMALSGALCEVDDEYYWMFHALGSAFATRAWLNTKHNRAAAARDDARTALRWIHRDPNAKAITKSEARGALERFDGWLARAASEKGAMTALHVMSHAMRVLVMYRQFAKAGDPAAKAVPARGTRRDWTRVSESCVVGSRVCEAAFWFSGVYGSLAAGAGELCRQAKRICDGYSS